MFNPIQVIAVFLINKYRAIIKFFRFIKWIIWNQAILGTLNWIKNVWNDYFWRHVVYWSKKIYKNISFFFWKTFPSKASEEEIKKYKLFIKSLGGWANIIFCSCCVRSWHFKILHSFLIDWEILNQFGMKILYFEWPYLKLAPRAYSKWLFRRLKILTNMPFSLSKRYRKSLYRHY
ncbi:hypothetical protein [Mycoplasma parvum]|uniref:Uncharacterized protein n=1 Tax=Mycoplasma parvum str. Indiana TaxID=1403316 RepID=U5NGG8_9MOLU|nr:hypothetical protein [Mycoplasma parvum]AGX89299.1 hypothetical protein PRV_02865 [Mycoplasma parvum str. Indiana]